MIVIVIGTDGLGPNWLSVAVTVNETGAVVVGTPLIVALVPFGISDKPFPNGPVGFQVQQVAAFPVELMTWSYIAPTSPFGSDVVVMIGACPLAPPAHTTATITAQTHWMDSFRMAGPSGAG